MKSSGDAAPARVAALRVYDAVEHGSATLPDALAAVQATLEDARDRALTAEIVSGTFRWRAALDHALAAHASRTLDALDPVILGILRLSAYQLLFLDRVPAHAVVFDAVALARTAKKQSAGGFVNAVLRKISAVTDRASLWPRRPERKEPPLPPSPPLLKERGDYLFAERQLDTTEVETRGARVGLTAFDYLTITLSHPRWLVERWVERYGFEAAEAWARFNNVPAPLTLRANTPRITRDDLQQQLAALGVVTEPTTFATDGLIVREGNPLQTPLAGQGLFTTQDEASQLVATIAQAALPAVTARPASRVLDACASPGGKTVALAAAVGANGIVVATDRRRRRIRLLKDTVAAAGMTPRVRIAQLDLTAPLPFPAVFDLVLVDAPCSGLGTLRREPEIRWRRTADDLARFADQQRRMLSHAAAAVRPGGGRLVYATCSSEPEENEAVAAAFLADHPGFRAVSIRDLALPPAITPAIDDAGHLRTYPFAHGLEAFFAAVFERRHP